MEITPTLGGRMELDFLAGLIAGLSSSAHCLAMCGGIAAAIALRTGEDGAPPWRAALGRARLIGEASAARIVVYVALGAVAGALGWGVSEAGPGPALRMLARYLAALVLVAAALTAGDSAVRRASGRADGAGERALDAPASSFASLRRGGAGTRLGSDAVRHGVSGHFLRRAFGLCGAGRSGDGRFRPGHGAGADRARRRSGDVARARPVGLVEGGRSRRAGGARAADRIGSLARTASP